MTHWAELFIRSLAILAAAQVLSRVPQRLASAYRHRLLLAGFVLLLIWPVLSAIVPQLYLPLWPTWRSRDSVTVQQTAFVLLAHTATPHVFPWPTLVWTIGTILALAPVALSYVNVLRLARRATPLNDAAFHNLLQNLCAEMGVAKAPKLLTIPEPAVPCTFGLRRPRILLPTDCLGWTPLRQRTVLLHELAHVQRRDVLTQLFAEIVTAVWWFQPLCWINKRRLRRESERACDVLVLASGMRPSDYATQLFEIAGTFSQGRRLSSAAIAMIRRSELENRLRAILGPQPSGGTGKAFSAVIAVLAAWSVAASAITLTPRQNTSLGGISMKRTFLSGLLSSVGLSAATIGGSLLDPSGAAVAQAKASLYNPETKVTAETTTAPDGKFTFDNLPAGQYILRVDKPGFASQFREFNVQADSKLERKLMLSTTEQQADSTADRQSSGQGPVRVGGEVAQENLVRKVQPVYPASAKAAGVQGTVDLEVVISKDGVPEEITVTSSPSDDLTQSSLEAVRQWRYRPTLLNGEPVDIVTHVIVNYTLSR
jgi:TonB family protein